jgi:hypothetical protein
MDAFLTAGAMSDCYVIVAFLELGGMEGTFHLVLILCCSNNAEYVVTKLDQIINWAVRLDKWNFLLVDLTVLVPCFPFGSLFFFLCSALHRFGP